MTSKIALLQYYAKSIHRDAEQRPEWTVWMVDISLMPQFTQAISGPLLQIECQIVAENFFFKALFNLQKDKTIYNI